MPTETKPKPAPGEINIADLPKSQSGNRTPIPGLADAISKELGTPPEAIALPEPSPDTPPKEKTPPEQPKREIAPPKETPKPASTPELPKKKDGIESVREALERAEKRAKEAAESATTTAKEKADAFAKVAELEGKVAKYEKEIESDYKPRVARLTELEKRLQQREETLKIKAYQETDEFHEKYIKPLADTQKEVGELLSELEVTEDGVARKATAQDFEEILAARSINEASKLAREKFGPDLSQQVVNYRTKIRGLERNRQEAVKDAALKAEEYEQRTMQQQTQAQQAFRDRLLAEANHLISGDPEIAVPDDDAELKTALTEGKTLADRLLYGDPNMSPDQFVSEIAKGRTAIISQKVLKTKVSRLAAEVESLKKQLKEYQSSEPDVVARSGGPAPVKSGDPLKDKLLAAAQQAAVAR